MANVSELLTDIEEKVARLAEQRKSLELANEQHRTAIHGLEQINQEQKRIIGQLQQKIDTVQTSNTAENKTGKVEAKARINELLREIDTCIGLLNG